MRELTRADAALVSALFLLDRLSKFAAARWLAGGEGVPLAPFFHLTYVENTGTAFGLLRGGNALLIAFTLAVLGYLLFNWGQLRAQGGAAPLRLIAAGALGNLYDRVFLGSVVDFLDFRVWPVFNIADSCICIGAGLLALALLRAPGQDTKEEGKCVKN